MTLPDLIAVALALPHILIALGVLWILNVELRRTHPPRLIQWWRTRRAS